MELQLVQGVMEVQAKFSWADLETELRVGSSGSVEGLETLAIFPKLLQRHKVGCLYTPSSRGINAQGIDLHGGR